MGAVEKIKQPGAGRSFEIIEVAEETAATTVYVAKAVGGDATPVSLERLRAPDAAARDRFLEVARLAARFGAPPARRVFSLGEVDGQPSIAWEALEGWSLEEVLGRKPSLLRSEHWWLVVCRLVAEAGELYEQLERTPRTIPLSATIRASDLWILRDGTTRVRLLEQLSRALPAPADASLDLSEAAASALGNALYQLLLGSAPSTAPSGALMVPQQLAALPVALQGIVLEAVAPDATRATMTVGALSRALRSFLRQQRTLDAWELADFVETDSAHERTVRSSGVVPSPSSADGPAQRSDETERSRGASHDHDLGDELDITVTAPEAPKSIAASPSAPSSISSPFEWPSAPSDRNRAPGQRRSRLSSDLFDQLPDLSPLGSVAPAASPAAIRRDATTRSATRPAQAGPRSRKAAGSWWRRVGLVALLLVLAGSVGMVAGFLWSQTVAGINWSQGHAPETPRIEQ